MECFVTYLKDIEGRIDPHYYRPSFIRFADELNDKNTVRIGDIANVICGPFGSSITLKDYVEEGVPLIRISNIHEDSLVHDDLVFISNEKAESLDSYKVKENDLIISQRGTLGLAAKVDSYFNGAIISANFIAIKDIKKIQPDYLITFLSSDFGKKQLTRQTSGQVQTKITTDDVKRIRVPIIPPNSQNQVINLMRSAYQLKRHKEAEAQNLLDSVDEYVLRELEIVASQGKDRRCFVAWAKELKGKRIDPKAYTSKPKAILESISKSKYPIRIVKELVAEQIAGYWGEDPALTENSENYILSNVIRNTDFDNNYNLNLEDVAQRLIPVKSYERIKVRAGDILLEKSGGSPAQPVGRVALITKEHEGCALSNFVQLLRIHKNECLPEYLFTYLRTIYRLGYMEYIQNQTTGIRNLILGEFMSIPIPVPSDSSIQDRIASEALNRVQKAKNLQQETIDSIEKAKAEVERLILGA